MSSTKFPARGGLVARLPTTRYVPGGSEAPALSRQSQVSRPSNGFAFRLNVPVHLEGPCMRCLEPAKLDLEVEAREIDQAGTDDPELRSPYVSDDELDIGRWAHDATILALPTRILCRPDCAGLCPVCGESLNDNPHEHEAPVDDRWAALKNLKLE